MAVGDAALERVLERSRSLGFLGPGSLRAQVEHAAGFAAGLTAAPSRALDLGAGGGLPGLVLARSWPGGTMVLLDASKGRCEFLEWAVGELALADRVEVVRARAEMAARDARLRGTFDLVVARGFGRPAVTAECGAPFLRNGGRLVVSDPPASGREVPRSAVPTGGASPSRSVRGGAGGDGSRGEAGPITGAQERWPAAALAVLGLVPEAAWARPFHFRSFVLDQQCPERYPRRDGVPAKRPLF